MRVVRANVYPTTGEAPRGVITEAYVFQWKTVKLGWLKLVAYGNPALGTVYDENQQSRSFFATNHPCKDRVGGTASKARYVVPYGMQAGSHRQSAMQGTALSFLSTE